MIEFANVQKRECLSEGVFFVTIGALHIDILNICYDVRRGLNKM